MKTELVDTSGTRKEIKIEIEQEAVREAYDRISDRYAKLANVPGFRRGHATRAVVRTRFKDEIRSEVLRELVPQAIQDAIAEHELDVLGEPDIHLDQQEALNQLGQQPLSLHVHVEVLPRVELGEYKGLEVGRSVRPVGEEDIDRVIEGLREASASLQPVEDRAAELGDIVTASFDGQFMAEPEAEHIKVEDVEVVLGGENVQPEFTENLLGTRPDEERTFTVKYPEDFSSKGLAGKEVAYTARVTAVGRKELPALDDEWARSLGEDIESLDALRQKIREDLENRAGAESDNRLRGELIEKLVDAHPFEVPETLVQHQTQHHLQTLFRDMMGRGIDPREQDMNWEGLREQMRGRAERDVRSSMLLESIAERENLSVSDEEVAAEIEQLAEATRQSQEQVRAALTKQGGERSIADRLRNRKALDLLVENARVHEAEWQEESALEVEQPPEQTEALDQAETAPTGEEESEETKAQSSSQDA
ncbi:MAG TPA: trigger factor [Pyrinomonadaceae bacterium]|jgi:trigger factor